jgi:hypothetical protein
MKAAAGNKPTLAFIADFKWATADQGEGLGTGEHDYGAGLDYVQPLGKMFQIRGEAAPPASRVVTPAQTGRPASGS